MACFLMRNRLSGQPWFTLWNRRPWSAFNCGAGYLAALGCPPASAPAARVRVPALAPEKRAYADGERPLPTVQFPTDLRTVCFSEPLKTLTKSNPKLDASAAVFRTVPAGTLPAARRRGVIEGPALATWPADYPQTTPGFSAAGLFSAVRPAHALAPWERDRGQRRFYHAGSSLPALVQRPGRPA
jgi:hypothetical protein